MGRPYEKALDKTGLTRAEADAFLDLPYWSSLVRSLHMKPDEINADLERLIPAAIDTKRDILSDSDLSPDLRDRVASDVLDRTGFSKVERREHHLLVFDARDVRRGREAIEDMLGIPRAVDIEGEVDIERDDPADDSAA